MRSCTWEVDGAVITLPTLYVYVLKAQTASRSMKTCCAKIHFPKERMRSQSDGRPIAPLRSGHVGETTGSGYHGKEFAPCLAPPGSVAYLPACPGVGCDPTHAGRSAPADMILHWTEATAPSRSAWRRSDERNGPARGLRERPGN